MEISEKRKVLINLSEQARTIREEQGLDCTINNILISEFYQDAENTTFKTFWDWKKEGYKIIKGSKAFLIWGKKREAQKQNENSEEPEEYKFFPVCYLFSNAQVEPSKNKKNADTDLQTAEV